MAAPSEVVVKFVIGAGFQNVTHEQAVSGKHPLTDEAFQQATVVYQSVEIPHGGKWSAHITRTWAAEFITEALKQDEHQNLVDWRITVGSKVNMWHFFGVFHVVVNGNNKIEPIRGDSSFQTLVNLRQAKGLSDVELWAIPVVVGPTAASSVSAHPPTAARRGNSATAAATPPARAAALSSDDDDDDKGFVDAAVASASGPRSSDGRNQTTSKADH